MIYDEIYKKFYHVVVSYSFHRLKDEYYAQEIANNTFKLLWVKWDGLDFNSENALLSWLYKVAAFKIKEHKRKKQNDYISLDNSNMRNIVDRKAAVDYEEIDVIQEEQKYNEYMSEVRKQLENDDLKLFDMIVISKLPYKQIAIELNTTVAAIKMRWLRLKVRLRQIVREITGEEL